MCHHWLVLEEMSTSYVLMLGKDPWELVPRFPKTLPRVPLPFADLASYSFAVINLSPEYNCLLNTVSPPNKPPHLRPLTQLPRPRTSFLPSLVQLAKPVMICPYYDLSRYFYWSPMCAHYLSDRHGWGRDSSLGGGACFLFFVPSVLLFPIHFWAMHSLSRSLHPYL